MANTTSNNSGNKLVGAPTLVKVPPNYPVEPQVGKLESLLSYNEYDIYHKFEPYTGNTNFLKFGREQPFIWRYIDEKDKSALPPVPANLRSLESRSFPLRSGTDDLLRMGMFLTSGKGVQFLAKQFLLQAQAPHDETNIYNPLEVELATARPLSLGLIPRPQRHINTSGGILGALASIIGINVSNGNTAPPSSVGQDALPTFNSMDGKGLLRARTANKGVSILNTKWPDGPLPNSLSGNLFNKLVKSATNLVTDTIKNIFKPLFPARQNGVLYRGDEIVFDRMRADKARRLTYKNKDQVDISVNEIRSEVSKVFNNNRIYNSIVANSQLSQYGIEQPYLDEYRDGISVVDESINSSRNFRMARAGAGDGINQIGILKSGRERRNNIQIEDQAPNYVGWTEWNPYRDDIIAFFFYDIVNEKFIPFRATIKGISDTTTAQWDELRFIGRADQIYTYSGFVRSMAFQFSIVITSLADLLPTWKKINYMKTSLKPSGYTIKDGRSYNRFIIPPMYTLTIGDMYKYQPIVINNFTINIPNDANWETLNEDNSDEWSYLHNTITTTGDFSGKYAQLPKEAEISIACNLLEKERAIVGGVDIGHNPRDENWNVVDSDKQYMPSPNKFDKNMLVRNENLVPDSYLGDINTNSTIPNIS